ncbi:isopentenyl diphosphate isomerase/L-lactate dehydrogenase-like FMN-dependent dehydrogenase [Bacillus mesophilus]|uniref:L-lactate oxidase n=1 Tax=Bacillus mesophilus TaxID=1808955 RepID=A0A6M0QBG6_9BACI|nr:lactate 2-monooxygenase [Bacillus mesophilus]MBM7663012.1 isopentenyl diphosphate isomerase/L-lactate dehydrogenase-like FMN-dependent dehydrogenase [Bacillus mesophilus]NEY73666.1 alpha-hydroxy-acid oxidizing protein [Bacillus mesophilus]
MTYGNQVQLKVYQQIEENIIPVTYEELEAKAKAHLKKEPFYYVAASAGAEVTARNNNRAFDKWQIVPRMLCDTSTRDLSVELYGKRYKYPILCAPVGVQSIIHPDGELGSARAAAAMEVPFVASTASTYSLEKVAEESPNGEKWFQLYWSSDREIAVSMVKRAETAGYSAIVITLDTPMMAWREKDIEHKYLPFLQGEGIGNYLEDPVFCSRLTTSPKEDMTSAIMLWAKIFGNPALTWKDLNYIRMQTNLPILLKGILHPDDARLALEHGVDGIIVSNHGGRQVDGAITSIEALPEICDVVQDQIPVLLDSGIRRGADIVKALSLGAKAVLVGRPYMYGLALAGEEGVKQVLRNLIADFDLTMALSGKSTISELNRDLLKKV